MHEPSRLDLSASWFQAPKCTHGTSQSHIAFARIENNSQNQLLKDYNKGLLCTFFDLDQKVY